MSKQEKKLLFSLTKENFEFQTFRAGGKGGGNQNARSTGVRCIHRDSGATGEARDSRHQWQNKQNAFIRMANSKEFKSWHKLEVARRLGLDRELERRVNEAVDLAMASKNLRVEPIRTENSTPGKGSPTS